jgi:threonine aldolase
MNRRHFLRNSGLGSLPILTGLGNIPFKPNPEDPKLPTPIVNFSQDNAGLSPAEYISKLAEIQKVHPIKADAYGKGGTIDELLQKFIQITGKEAAVYMPSGTLANQLAIHVLCAGNTKVFVQETSHVFRDEADAAQSLFNKRLIPLAKGKHYFSADELKTEAEYVQSGEYFKSPIGAVAIENPVRRCYGQIVPLEEIKAISAWCKKEGYKLHLDGARLHFASAYSGISVKEYASHFDTVYMCLYKYLGASSGAVLCGDKVIIDQMEHHIKIHGGAMYRNWTNAAMALSQLDGIDDRLKRSKEKADLLFSKLNEINGVKITAIPQGSNIFNLKLAQHHNPEALPQILWDKYVIGIAPPMDDGFIKLHVNESILLRDVDDIVRSFKGALGVNI